MSSPCSALHNRLKPCAEGMRFEHPIESAIVSNSQELQLPVNSPLIDDAHALSEDNTVPASYSDDDNVLNISATAHEDNAVDNDVTPNVSDALAEGNDQTATEMEPRQERSASDLSVIDSTSQPM